MTDLYNIPVIEVRDLDEQDKGSLVLVEELGVED